MFTLSLAGVLLLAGCGGQEEKAKDRGGDDPAVHDALADEIMVDPELTGQNQAKAGIAPGSNDTAVPPAQRTPEAIAAIAAEAARLVGGRIEPAPAPTGPGDVAAMARNAATAAQVAAAAKTGNADCAAKVAYSATWASALPTPLQVYPQGAVQEAAGTDTNGCRLRVVNFLTPVAPQDVVDFYYTRVRAGGYDARHSAEGDAHVLGGKKGAAAYVIYVRGRKDGMTEVDLVSGGG